MADTPAADPVAILKEIEECCRACSIGFSGDTRNENEWSGIAFRIGGNNLVAPLGEVVEILDVPDLTMVPLTRPWVRGLANLRGNLLPVIDLNGYLHGEPARLTGKSRVLVIDCEDVYSGLVVDEVLGMKHFREQELTAEDCFVDPGLQPYCHGGFRRKEQAWAIFSMLALAATPKFLQTAV